MALPWNMSHYETLRQFLRDDIFREALEMFCKHQAADFRELVQAAILNPPAKVEQAIRYGSQALTYDEFVSELDRAVEKFKQ